MLTFLFFIGCTFVEFLHPEYKNGNEKRKVWMMKIENLQINLKVLFF